MNHTDEQHRIANRIIDVLSEDDQVVAKDSLIALSIVIGLVMGEARYDERQRAMLLGLMLTHMVEASAPEEE